MFNFGIQNAYNRKGIAVWMVSGWRVSDDGNE